MRTLAIAPGLSLDRDVAVEMRDGVRLSLNVFRAGVEPAPVILSVTPYGKDRYSDPIQSSIMRLSGVRFGALDRSRWATFEAPDPLYWTRAGYTVVQADVRGMHGSEGHAGVLTEQDADDYAELIEWCAAQPWSTGRVGLLGVSYLAMSQWQVAALRPPSLAAICPWEGVTDLLRELGYQDGIPETGFVSTWWRFRMRRGHNRSFAMAEDFPVDRDAHPLDDVYWAAKRPDLEQIEVPALVCASWSDHGLHTRGSIEGFMRIGSPEKWLYTHGRRKWETFYSQAARETQRRFFDHFLKGDANGWEDTPRVRLEVRRSRTSYEVRHEPVWPIPGTTVVELHLDPRAAALVITPPQVAGSADYDPNARDGRISFVWYVERETEITGSASVRLWVSTTDGDDLDVFVVLRKLDAAGREVPFFGYNGYSDDVVAKGWLRVSHRELDPALSRPGRPWHTHRTRWPVQPGEIVDIEIEIQASSTLFEAGSALRLDILGHDAARYPVFRHGVTANRGRHWVHTGPDHPSMLVVPVKQRRDDRG